VVTLCRYDKITQEIKTTKHHQTISVVFLNIDKLEAKNLYQKILFSNLNPFQSEEQSRGCRKTFKINFWIF